MKNTLNMKNRIIFSAAIVAVVCALTSAQGQTNAMSGASLGNPVIARGTGLEIKRGDLDEAMAGYKAQMLAATPAQVINAQKQILNGLINTKLLLAKATDDDKAAGKKAADLQITAAIENVGSQQAFDLRLKTNGMTEAVLRSRLTDDATAQAVVQRELKVAVTDDDVKNFYDSHRISGFETPEMASVSHILIFMVDPVTREALNPDQQTAQRKLVEDLVKNIRVGVDFKVLARQYSEDVGSKDSGGALPPFPRGQMSPEIDAAVFSMTNNQVSVITNSTGYHIFKMLEKIPASKTPYMTAVPKIRDYLTQQQMQKLAPAYLQGLRAAAGMQILDPALAETNAVPSSP